MSRKSRGSTLWWLAALAVGTTLVWMGVRRGWWESPLKIPDEPADVVLYSSVDGPILQPIIDSFTQRTGIKVRLVGDTEATKTTGLVERLIAEKQRPRADVWWSNEPLGSLELARVGVLEPFTSKAIEAWPEQWRAADRGWYAHALRFRVIAYNTNRLHREEAPTRLRELADPRWKGRVGIARPAFGTTRAQIASLVATSGVDTTRAWLESLRDNNVRIYDGNSAVVQALALGEIEVGLTDTDDVQSARRNGWPVECVFETPDAPDAAPAGLRSLGPLALPSTVGLVKGSPHPIEAAMLIEHILSAEVERTLASGDGRNMPVRSDVAAEFPNLLAPNAYWPRPETLAEAIPAATGLAHDVLGAR